ncbi:TRI47 protein, partial [Crypturellus soui]|nr:TRI47 protein [Crypturellus soui]
EEKLVCSICLELFRTAITLPCGHNFCRQCISDHWDKQEGSGVEKGYSCPECRKRFERRLELQKNVALCSIPPLEPESPSGPEPPPESPLKPEPPSGPMAPGAEEEEGAAVLCDVCPPGSRAAAARSCLVCLASFCAPHLEPHGRSAAFRTHRLVAPLRRLEERLCPRHLQPLDGFCRAEQLCVCARCRAHEHRAHDVVPLEREREHKEGQRAKFLSNVENELEELAVTVAQTRKMVELIKGAATKERERVEKLFTEASDVLAAFRKEVVGFIEDGERSRLAEAEADLRWKEERRAKLAQCKQNLESVPSTDTIYFLQEFQALKIAMEENLSPAPSFQNELSFTKSAQAVSAVKEVLAAACKNQRERLLGKGGDGLSFQETEEGLCPPGWRCHRDPRVPSMEGVFLLAFPLHLHILFLPHAVAFIIDLDSDTADKFIQLFGTKGAKRVLCPIPYPESVTRFINCEQVLGENVMNRGNYYWEVELIDGWVSIGVVAEDFNPRESYDRGRLGRNDKSCCLQWNGQNYAVWFGGFESVIQQPFFQTIGVFLEYSEKALTFYGVKDSKMTCLQQLKVSRFKKGQFDAFQNKINHQFPSLFSFNLKPAFFLESVDAHLQIGPLKKDCVSVLKRR